MRVIRCWSGTNALRALCAGIVLVAAGYTVLGWNSHGRSAQNAQAHLSALEPRRTPIASSPFAISLETKSRALQAFNRLPLMFEPNVGQIGPAESGDPVKFLARGAGYSLLLGYTSALIELQPAHNSDRYESLRMKLAGASPVATVAAADPLPGKTNYFIGNDSSKWYRKVPQFARVRYENIYPGINLIFYGNQGRLEYDFQVGPGADPQRVELEFEGSRKIELRDGTLTVKAENGNLRLEAPRIYQQIENRRQPVEGRFVMRAANRVGFEIGPYDRNRELIIDPTLTTGFSTYFGGSGAETSPSVAVDTAQNVYLAGSTTSPVNTFPQPTGALTQNGPSPNVFVARLDSTGASVTYLTFLGGDGTDTNVGIAVDGGQNAYIAGNTSSSNFPTTPTTAYQTAPEAGSAGTSHVYVSVLDSTGSVLKYSSYLSGNGIDIASGMAIDNKADLFVTGTTTSSDQSSTTDAFPAAAPPTAQQAPFQSFPFATLQFFVSKVNTQTAGVFSIAYSTYFGGGTPTSPTAVGGGIAVDSTGNVYFTGTTNFIFTGSGRPPDFPILNAYQPCLDQPPPTTISNPPTCTFTVAPTATDAFVAKLNPNTTSGSQLIWSTYFGGGQTDSGVAIAVDTGAANVYLTGATNSPDFIIPTSTAPYQQCLDVPPPNPASGTACAAPPDPSATDAYVARLNNPATGNMALTYFSYLGGAGNDAGSAITVDTASGAILTGSTASGDFPVTPNALQSVLKGAQDAFFARINTTTTTTPTVGEFVTYFGGSGVDRGTGIAIDSGLNTYLAGDTNSADLPTEAPLQANLNGPSDAFVAKLGTSADLCVDKNCAPPTVSPTVVSAGSQVTFTYTITNLGPDLATNIQFNDNWTGQPVTFVSAGVQSGSGSCSSSGTTAVCFITSLQAGSTAQVKIVLTVTAAGGFNGGTVTVSSTENDPDPSNNQTSKTAQATDFTVSISPPNKTIGAAGETGVYLVTLTPLPPPFSSSISLSCSSGVPGAAACTFTANPVTLNNGPATSTLNLITTARPVTTASSGSGLGPLYAIWLGIPGMTLLGLGASRDRRRRRIAACLLLVLLSGLLLLQPACSHQKTPPVVGGTPAGTYTIILTATSGSVSHNTSFTLTVP